MKLKTSLAFLMLFLASESASAWTWQDLFATKDQQAADLFQKNHPFEAAERFKNPNWKGVAYYKSGDYRRAIAEFSQHESELNLYNRSLAYARLGDFEEAINDLDRVIDAHPENQKAKDNREIFKMLQKQQSKSEGQQERNQSEKHDKKQSSMSQQPRNSSGSKPEEQKSPDELNDGNHKRPKPGDTANKNRQDNSNQANSGDNNDPSQGEKTPQPQKSMADREQEQAKQQWLKRIPDDPGGLLREKFLRDYQRRQQDRG